MVAILITKKIKSTVVNHVIISSYAALLWFGEISPRIYSPKNMTIKVNRIQSNAIEHNRIFQSFLFSIGIRLIRLIEFQSFDYVRLFSIKIFDWLCLD